MTPKESPSDWNLVGGSVCTTMRLGSVGLRNLGALINKIGFPGPLCENYTKEPPQNSIGNYLGPYSRLCASRFNWVVVSRPLKTLFISQV